MDDVTPDLIEQIDFSEKFKGYDRDEVDDFLERVGATVVTLRARLAEAQARAQRAEAEVVALRERPAPAPAAAPAPVVSDDDEEVEQATRTLVLAKRTAEAAIAEARQEASKLLTDAKTRSETELADATAESDRLLREAQSQREELISKARQEAEAELSGERERLQKEISELDQHKSGLINDLGRLEARMSDYRTGLEKVHGAIAAVLEDPEALKSRPVEVETSTVSSAFYYTGSNPVVAAADSVTLATGPVPVVDVSEPATESHDSPIGSNVESGPGDPWAPGSWSEVSPLLEGTGSATEVSSLALEERFEPKVADEVVRPVAPAASEDQTRGFDVESDQYLDELDAAVNKAGTADGRMQEFFEQDPRGKGRFGRRR